MSRRDKYTEQGYKNLIKYYRNYTKTHYKTVNLKLSTAQKSLWKAAQRMSAIDTMSAWIVNLCRQEIDNEDNTIYKIARANRGNNKYACIGLHLKPSDYEQFKEAANRANLPLASWIKCICEREACRIA